VVDISDGEEPEIRIEKEQDVGLYPNPVIEYLSVFIPVAEHQDFEFEVYNVIGNRMDIEVLENSDNKYKISVRDFKSGYYLLVIKDPVKRYNKAYKFQKE
jgi:hypothetical protein